MNANGMVEKIFRIGAIDEGQFNTLPVEDIGLLGSVDHFTNAYFPGNIAKCLQHYFVSNLAYLD